VDDAYRTTIAPGLRPDFLLYLHVPRDAVDVNVHPSKTEVRFRDRERVERALTEAVRLRLGRISSAPELGRKPSRDTATGPREPAVREGSGPGQFALFMTEADEGEEKDETAAGAGSTPLTYRVRPELNQLNNTYILAATRRGLLIIDQHSAHERVLFEELMGRFGESGGNAQRLLFPLTLRLSPAEYSAVEELAPLLSRVGFEVEPFGDRTVIVRSSPNPHAYFDAERCFSEMIHELAEGSPLVDAAGNQHERIAKSLACKGAIKAGQPLSQEEMADLFDRLFATELPGHDVHGRPTVVRLTLEELGRRFGRAGSAPRGDGGAGEWPTAVSEGRPRGRRPRARRSWRWPLRGAWAARSSGSTAGRRTGAWPSERRRPIPRSYAPSPTTGSGFWIRGSPTARATSRASPDDGSGRFGIAAGFRSWPAGRGSFCGPFWTRCSRSPRWMRMAAGG
jgi:hypothetical protein